MFFESDEQGRVGFRGRYLSEFNEQDYATKITGMSISGFKGKDLNELAHIFPMVQRLTIEKTSNLKSLNGIEKFASLCDVRIEECSKLAKNHDEFWVRWISKFEICSIHDEH
jgi:hypothetical protein